MVATKLYDGTDSLVRNHANCGGFLYTLEVSTDGEKVKFLSLMQKNYTVIDRESLSLTREEAIAAAKAILKHFDQDWNAYEENISERYRAPTAEEMERFLADDPNYKPIPQEALDPDLPLTSELAQNFGEE